MANIKDIVEKLKGNARIAVIGATSLAAVIAGQIGWDYINYLDNRQMPIWVNEKVISIDRRISETIPAAMLNGGYLVQFKGTDKPILFSYGTWSESIKEGDSVDAVIRNVSAGTYFDGLYINNRK